MTRPTCACGEITWPAGVISVYCESKHHWPADLICFETDDLWAIA